MPGCESMDTEWRQVAGVAGLEVWRGPGRGPAVVLVHGMEASWSTWRAVAGHLPDCSAYALRMPWCSGAEAGWREDGSPAEWLRRALELLPEQPAALVAHSFGAHAVLSHLAQGGPHPVVPVVLVAPFYRPSGFPVTPALELRARAAFRGTLVEGMRLAGGRRMAKLDPEVAAGMVGKLWERVMPTGFPLFYAEFIASGDVDLSRVTAPVLILTGPHDEGLTSGRADALAAALPAATLRGRSFHGHFGHVTAPAVVARDVADWIERHMAQPYQPIEGEPSVNELLDGEPTNHIGRPRYEGANIRTWIGFKNFMYLVEEAVLEYFRERAVSAQTIYHRYGLGLEIVDSSVQLPMTLQIDDQVTTTILSGAQAAGRGLSFKVRMTVERDGEGVKVLTGKVRVALVPVKDGSGTDPVPAFLEPYVVPEVAMLKNPEAGSIPIEPGQSVEDVLVPAGSGAYLWSWRAPYYMSHFSDRLQHSAYVRRLEEVVDNFLAARGLAIGKLLVERAWIPVVSRARVQMLDDVWMEETVHTVFTVEDVIHETIYTARMDCYVQRGADLVRTATASIVHGYAISRGEGAGTVAKLDPATVAALRGDQL